MQKVYRFEKSYAPVRKDLFGIVKPDGNRHFWTAFVEICKKAGKSELAAAVTLYLLYAAASMKDGSV